MSQPTEPQRVTEELSHMRLATFARLRGLRRNLQPQSLQQTIVRLKSTALPENTFTSQFPDVSIPSCTIPDLIWEQLDRWPDKIAVECGIVGKRYTYVELRTLSLQLAAALLKSGLRPEKGDVVTALLPNMPEYVVTILGAMEAGLIFTGINPIYSSEEIVFQLKDSGSSFVIVHPDLLEKLLEAKSTLGRELTIMCIHDYDGKPRNLPPGVHGFSDFIHSAQNIKESDVRLLRNDPVDLSSTTFLPYSSGTTGLPKGVCLSHANLTANICQASYDEINPIDYASKNYQDAVPLILPLFHIYGSVIVMMRPLLRGAKLITLPKFDPKSFVDTLEKNENIVLHGVPPIILFLSSHPMVTSSHLDHIKFSMTGGAPCSGEDIQKLKERKDHPIIQGYGMTESSPLLTQSRISSKNYASIGKLLSNTEAKIIDVNSGNSLPINETGELCFRGPQVMKGYHKRPEATAETVDAGGWLHTGDIGYVDEAGDFYVVDRIKELIKVKGFQVAPAELEGLLRSHPDVADAGVTALPSTRSGEEPIAFIIRKSQAKSDDEKRFKDYIASKVAPYKQISKIVFVEQIPKSSTGKILRRELKEMAKQLYSHV